MLVGRRGRITTLRLTGGLVRDTSKDPRYLSRHSVMVARQDIPSARLPAGGILGLKWQVEPPPRYLATSSVLVVRRDIPPAVLPAGNLPALAWKSKPYIAGSFISGTVTFPGKSGGIKVL